MMKSMLRGAGAACLALAVAACGPPVAPPAAPAEVGVVTVSATRVALTRDFPGRLAATLVAQVPARVTGNVLKRVYTEGTDVKAGQVLFLLDPAPLEATVRSLQGLVAQAEATAHDAELKATRSKALGERGLLARQDVDDAVAAAAEAEAGVKAARANLENASIDLGYATVTAPISGRAGIANFTQGALVQPTSTTPLTTIQVIDPIYANFSEPLVELERLQQAARSGDLKLAAPDAARVRILLPDGRVYAHAGTLDFTDLAVDPTTGAVELRAVVPNPAHSLLPGMFVTIRLTLGLRDHTFEVPQAAVLRDARGAYVLVVGAGGKVAQKHVALDGERGSDWLVQSGLATGDRVIVSGIQKAQPGDAVKAVPYVPAAATAASAASASSAAGN